MLSLIFLSFTCLIVPVLGSILVDVIFFSSIFGLVTFLEDVFFEFVFFSFSTVFLVGDVFVLDVAFLSEISTSLLCLF